VEKIDMKKKITLNEHRLWVILHQADDLMSRGEEEVLQKAGITSQQFLVLWIMEFLAEIREEPIIIADLAPILYRRLNSISLIVDRMEKNGLVKKVRDLPDRRAIRLIPTRKAERIFSAASKPNREFIKRIFSVFTDEEQETLLFLMKKLKKKLNEELEIENPEADPELNTPKNIEHFINKLY
jgi:DNA-binding MarR family transcriptional regulator